MSEPSAASASFVHLRIHSEFSLADSLIRIKPLVAATAQLGMPALAVTDQSTLCSLVRFYKNAQAAGLKPLSGCDLWVENRDPELPPTRLVLLCMNTQGYKNLIQLVSAGFTQNQQQGRALVKREWIFEHSDHLIALSGGQHGEIGRALMGRQPELADSLLDDWLGAFGDRFYLELHRTGRAGEEDYLHAAVELAGRRDLPVVATNDVMFLQQSDFGAHEARVCIGEGWTLEDKRRPKNYSDQQYLKSPQEMCALFADIPEAIANTVEIARRCTLEMELGTCYLPDFPVPEGKSMDVFFREITEQGLDKRLETILDPNAADYAEQRQIYRDRLVFEQNIILQMGFPGYFLVVMDFIRWARENAIPVGPGRGSGAGSLVAYALRITDLDPIEYDLLFERFLNPERVSMPDFDVDFCMDNRDRVIDYVARTYGRDAVSQIITFGTMAAKAVVKDVARVQGKSYNMADRLSRLIPFEPGMTLGRALEQEEPLRDFLASDEDAREVWDMALKLEGVTRNMGKHAGGVVIAPTRLTDFSALYCDEQGQGLVTQYDKDDVEAVGLVKFDFLGLRTLTTIDWALKMINRRRQAAGETLVDINRIDLEDPRAYQLLRQAKTTAVFQLESRGMKDLIKRLQPDCFEDIVALVALFRPGPLQSGMVDNFINRKHGREELSYPDAQWQHEWLKPILQPTYGIILYQEQVMQIAQVLAGYTLGGADMLRRAMGKKKPEEMAKQRAIFEQGAVSQNIDATLAMKLFDLVEKFAGYGFNKSHSAAYALVSYQTLWLKQYYPAEFMAAVLSSDLQNTDKVVILVEECRDMGLTVLAPDVNTGGFSFEVNDDGHVVYGLGAVKGVGEGPVEALVLARAQGGPFRDLFDLCLRVDGKKLNKRCLEALLYSGALDSLGPCPGPQSLNNNRAVLAASMAAAIKAADQAARNSARGLNDLFGEPSGGADTQVRIDSDAVAPWSGRQRLQREKDTLGFYLSGHPIDEYNKELDQISHRRIAKLQPGMDQARLFGLITALKIMKNKSGSRMAFLTLDDGSGQIEVALFSEAFNRFHELLVKDTLVAVEGEVRFDDRSESLKVTVRQVMSLTQTRSQHMRALELAFGEEHCQRDQMEWLHNALTQHPGQVPVVISFTNSTARGQIRLGDQWAINPDDTLIDELQACYGNKRVRLVYQ